MQNSDNTSATQASAEQSAAPESGNQTQRLGNEHQHLGLLPSLYQKLVLARPLVSLLVLLALIVGVVQFATQFQLDASADSLTLEDDQDLAYYREARKDFPSSDDFLVIAFSPSAPLFSEATINSLIGLKQDLLKLPRVKAVNSILDVPLLNHPELSLTNVSDYLETLEGGYSDMAAAQKAFVENPFYRDLLVSPDAKTSAMQIILKTNPRHTEAVEQRNALRAQARQAPLPETQAATLAALELEVKQLNQAAIDDHAMSVRNIRSVIRQHDQNIGQVFLGGIPMIVVDMLDYVRNDVRIFGLGVVAFLVVMLAVLFRRALWVIMPLFCALITCLVMVGYLGYLRFPVTVISSNFISLLLIITMSMIIHLMVRYRELVARHPDWSQKQLVLETTLQMGRPCLYTSLTTIVAFISLVVSNIRPVIDFGVMMTIGICVAYASAFLLFPVILSFFPREPAPAQTNTQSADQAFSVRFAKLTERMGNSLVLIAVVVGVLSAWGISQLSVENRFIDYFKESTEIHQGMKKIDEQLGGTTPLDIIIDVALAQSPEDSEEDCFLDDECMDDVYGEATVFTQARLSQYREIQQWLESLPETGKVLSVATTIEMAELIKGAPLEALELAFLNAMFPDDLRGLLLDPYVNEANGKVRFSLRVIESDASLRRQALLDKIHNYLVNEQGLSPSDVHFTSMVVLYNNMLQSLFKSQIATIGVVFGCIMVMFLVLFRSVYLALIGILPNMLAAGVVMGMMGFLNIPLDMMTITIAAISVGIAVDNTIHYIYRFKAEFAQDRQYKAAMFRSHATIGKAMYYTSITIIFGFSILALSSFYPTIYFGLFTGLAMLIALLASLTLLPQLIVMLKPLGAEVEPVSDAPVDAVATTASR